MRNGRVLGVFDSGIGGLTVVRHLRRLLPEWPIVYFGDTARVPYGTKSDATVRRFGEEAVRFLTHFDVFHVVVACNTVSAVALRPLQREFRDLPITGVILPGAEAAVRTTQNGRIGVIGTRATIASGAYENAITAAARRGGLKVRVTSVACPLLVPLAEEGMEHSRAARDVLEDYLEPLKRSRIDTLILGCTHYPPFRRALQRVLGARVKLVDSGEATARQLARDTSARRSLRSGRGSRHARGGSRHGRSGSRNSAPLRCYVSDIPRQFERIGRRFLGTSMGKVSLVPQDDLPWFERSPIREGRGHGPRL
jgi:glutamate racemase